MKKVLCGLVIALMMIGNVYADKLSYIDQNLNPVRISFSSHCNELEKRINFHLGNAREFFIEATRKKSGMIIIL